MRIVAIIALALAAFMILVGTVTGSWGQVETSLLDSDVTIRWGLLSQTHCAADGLFSRSCDNFALDDVGWPGSSVSLGLVTFLAGLLVSAWLAVGALLAGLERRSARLVNVTGMVGAALALVPAALFTLFIPPSHEVLEPSLGSSFWLFVFGCVLGIAGTAVATRTVDRPTGAGKTAPRAAPETDDDDGLAPPLSAALPPGAPRGALPSPVPIPPPPVQVPLCPSCGQSGVWLHEVRSFRCVRCNRALRSSS